MKTAFLEKAAFALAGCMVSAAALCTLGFLLFKLGECASYVINLLGDDTLSSAFFILTLEEQSLEGAISKANLGFIVAVIAVFFSLFVVLAFQMFERIGEPIVGFFWKRKSEEQLP